MQGLVGSTDVYKRQAYYLYVNGEYVGYATDSYTAHDFNITPYLNEKGEENTLALKVFRWSIGSYLENQDYINESGIFRDVYLYSKGDVCLLYTSRCV